MLKRTRKVTVDEAVGGAMRIAFDRGLYAISMSTLADELSVSEREVRESGLDRDHLIAESFRRIVRAELDETRRTVLTEADPVEQLGTLLTMLAMPPTVDVDAVWLESWSLGRRISVLGAAVRDEEAAWHDFVVAVLRRGVELGRYRPVDPERVAAQLLATIDGVNAYALVGYRSDLDRAAMLRSVAENALGIALTEPEGSTVR